MATILTRPQCVKMLFTTIIAYLTQFVLRMAVVPTRVVSKCIMTVSGAQYVMIPGMTEMLTWCAAVWDLTQERLWISMTLAMALAPSGWMKWSVMEANLAWISVNVTTGAKKTARIMKMPASFAVSKSQFHIFEYRHW